MLMRKKRIKAEEALQTKRVQSKKTPVNTDAKTGRSFIKNPVPPCEL